MRNLGKCEGGECEEDKKGSGEAVGREKRAKERKC